jgi:hypothetical protein
MTKAEMVKVVAEVAGITQAVADKAAVRICCGIKKGH